jgi:hypothetical protein
LIPAIVVAVALASSSAPDTQLTPSAPRPADPEPENEEEPRAESSWLVPKERPVRSPLPVTFSMVAALAGGTRSFHGSFGVSIGSQHLSAPRRDGQRRFVSIGASAFVRWYTPHPQVGCGGDAVPPPPRSPCPATLSIGPTFRYGIVRNDSPSFTVPHQRLEIAVTPFLGREPLRDPDRADLAMGARLALSATYAGFSQDVLDDSDAFTGSGGTLAFIALLPAALLNHIELYGEPMILDGNLFVSVGLGLGFGL